MEGGDNAIDNKQFNWTKFSKGYSSLTIEELVDWT